MKSDQVHLLIIACIIAGGAYYIGFKAGTYFGSNKELARIVKEARNGKI